MSTVSSVLDRVKAPVRGVQTYLRPFVHSRNGRYCPVCREWSSRFGRFGIVPRDDAQCLRCGALERHRLLFLFLKRNTSLFERSHTTMLHVAPEACLESHLREALGDGYLTADLFDPRAMVRMDVTDIQYPNGYFDVLSCAHVLEHVANDRQALAEFHRVLADDGWATILVPITAEKTFEDASIVDPQDRLAAFGQEDHVRVCGPDYADRIRDAGFSVKIVTVKDVARPSEMLKMGLTPACGEIYYCTKQKN